MPILYGIQKLSIENPRVNDFHQTVRIISDDKISDEVDEEAHKHRAQIGSDGGLR